MCSPPRPASPPASSPPSSSLPLPRLSRTGEPDSRIDMPSSSSTSQPYRDEPSPSPSDQPYRDDGEVMLQQREMMDGSSPTPPPLASFFSAFSADPILLYSLACNTPRHPSEPAVPLDRPTTSPLPPDRRRARGPPGSAGRDGHGARSDTGESGEGEEEIGWVCREGEEQWSVLASANGKRSQATILTVALVYDGDVMPGSVVAIVVLIVLLAILILIFKT